MTFALPAKATAQTFTLAPFPPTVFSNAGQIINAACIWTYLTGGTTPVTTYSTANGTANANPIIADSAGRFIAYLTPGVTYRFVYEAPPCSSSSHGSVLRTVDGIAAVPTAGQNVDVTGTAGENLTAGDVVYLSDGSGSKTAGQWYQADADLTYASNLSLQIGIVTATVTTGGSVTVRMSGTATNLSLSAGARYYVSATAGALTTTAPTNARFVGVADSTTTLILPGPSAWPDPVGPCQGRLTGTSGSPITTGDVSAAATIYFSPFGGATCAVYDSTNQVWVRLLFSELTISVASCTLSKPYDVFVYNNGGALAAEQLVWTNDTTRATAVTLLNGAWVKSGQTSRRLVGSYYCNSTGGQTDDTFAKRNICNADLANKVRRQMRVRDTTDTWGYNAATTWRQARAAATNQLEFLACTGLEALAATVQSMASPDGAVAVTILVGIGLDATNATATGSIQNGSGTAVANERVFMAGSLNTYPGVGRHVATWLEWLSTGTATTFYGDNGGGQNQSGIAGEMEL